MPLLPDRPLVPSFAKEVERGELDEKAKRITEYYQNLDENDPANQPTDDETKTQPPIKQVIEQAKAKRQGEG